MPAVNLLCCKKWSTYITMTCFFLAGGIEYSVIFPTMFDYVETFGGEEWLYGLSLSAFSISNLITSPLYGLIFDKTKMTKVIVLVGNLFEIGGNFMYFSAYAARSKYLILGSRFVVGMGAGAGAAIFAELALTTTKKQRTTIFSLFMAMRQLGLVIGPAFNLFLQVTDFSMGPFPVNPFSSPGLFMMLLWIIVELMFIFCFFHLPRVKQEPESETSIQSTTKNNASIESPDHSSDHMSKPVQSYSSRNSSPGIVLDVGEPPIEQSQLTRSTKDMFCSHSLTSQQRYSVNVVNTERTPLLSSSRTNSPSSRTNSKTGPTNSNLDPTSGQIVVSNQAVLTKKNVSGRRNGTSPTLINNSNSFDPDSTRYTSFPADSPSCQDLLASNPEGDEMDTQREEHKGCLSMVRRSYRHAFWLASEMIREEIVVLLTILFVTMFNQAAVETMFVPMAKDLLNWDEKEISYFYSGAGIEIIVAFVVVSIVSRKIGDRWQMLVGLFFELVGYSWLLGLVGNATSDTPWVMWRYLIGGFLLLWGLPLIMVTGASLYSKLLPVKIQGFGQGVRRSVFSVGAIMGPLWAGGAVSFGGNYYVLFGVPCGLLIFAVLMLILSFNRIKEPPAQKQMNTTTDTVKDRT